MTVCCRCLLRKWSLRRLVLEDGGRSLCWMDDLMMEDWC